MQVFLFSYNYKQNVLVDCKDFSENVLDVKVKIIQKSKY